MFTNPGIKGKTSGPEERWKKLTRDNVCCQNDDSFLIIVFQVIRKCLNINCTLIHQTIIHSSFVN